MQRLFLGEKNIFERWIVRYLKRYGEEKNFATDGKIREQGGKLAGSVGIFVNLFLCLIKIFFGWYSGAISLIGDGLNNLSDASSSIVTLWAFRMASRPADPEHPFGHGRIENLGGLFIVAMIIFVGFELFKTSIEKILNPENLIVDWIIISIAIASIVVKMLLKKFYSCLAKKIRSSALEAAAVDSLSDCWTTAVVVIGLLIYDLTGNNFDGYVGVIVALFILYSGYEAGKDTVQPLLGEPPSREILQEIETEVKKTKGILGMHDLIVHNYGMTRNFASLHVEVSAQFTLLEAHEIIDELEQRLKEKFSLMITIHLDPVRLNDGETNVMKHFMEKNLKSIDENLSLHDFRIVTKGQKKRLIFDVIVPHEVSKKFSDDELKKKLENFLDQENYLISVNFDHQFC